MSLNPADIKELKAIVDWANLTDDVRELSLKVGEVELFISRNEHSPGSAPAAVPAPVAASAVPVVAPAPAVVAPVVAPVAAPAAAAWPNSNGELAAGEVVVKAPMVGTFYGSPQPGAPSFVAVGDTVQADTVLAIVEVMKLMNNIEAGVAGTVVRVLAENESAVSYGQSLFVIKQA